MILELTKYWTLFVGNCITFCITIYMFTAQNQNRNERVERWFAIRRRLLWSAMDRIIPISIFFFFFFKNIKISVKRKLNYFKTAKIWMPKHHICNSDLIYEVTVTQKSFFFRKCLKKKCVVLVEPHFRKWSCALVRGLWPQNGGQICNQR